MLHTLSLLTSALLCCFFFFSSRRRHTRFDCDWSSDVCSSDLAVDAIQQLTVDATGGTFSLTYAPQPLQLTADAGAAPGLLAAGNYFYQVTAEIGRASCRERV